MLAWMLSWSRRLPARGALRAASLLGKGHHVKPVFQFPHLLGLSTVPSIAPSRKHLTAFGDLEESPPHWLPVFWIMLTECEQQSQVKSQLSPLWVRVCTAAHKRWLPAAPTFHKRVLIRGRGAR